MGFVLILVLSILWDTYLVIRTQYVYTKLTLASRNEWPLILVLKNARKLQQVALHAYLCSGAGGALYNFAKCYAGGAIFCNFIRLAQFQNNCSLISEFWRNPFKNLSNTRSPPTNWTDRFNVMSSKIRRVVLCSLRSLWFSAWNSGEIWNFPNWWGYDTWRLKRKQLLLHVVFKKISTSKPGFDIFCRKVSTKLIWLSLILGCRFFSKRRTLLISKGNH